MSPKTVKKSMSIIGLSRSASAQLEEKWYSFQTSASVYVGLVRASLQDKFPLLSKHPVFAILAAVAVVCLVQSLILGITLITKTFALVWMLPALFGSVLAYVPLVNKWV